MRANDCDIVSRVSERVATWISSQPNVGEESLTDWLLFELSAQLPRLRYHKFTRHEEARTTGADWEWWILGDDGHIGLRVQAKRITERGDNYASLAYTNRHGLQIEKLRSNAHRHGLLALYALYASDVAGSTHRCMNGPQASVGSDGVFLAAANSLYRDFIVGGKRPADSAAVLQGSKPLSCMFCCPLVHRQGALRHGLYSYLEHYYGSTLSAEDGAFASTRGGNLPFGMHSEPPSYVLRLLQFERGVPEWWENEHPNAAAESRALLVLDMRGTDAT